MFNPKYHGCVATNMIFHVLFMMTFIGGRVQTLRHGAITSIKNDIGDIYDCVDIYKQPAFEHPALRNHTIQMRPGEKLFASHEQKRKNSTSRFTDLTKIKCPAGTVSIPRIAKQTSHSVLSEGLGSKFAGVRVSAKILYGAYAYISLYNPRVNSDGQFSRAIISIERNRDKIIAGWMVNAHEYGDRQTRFFSYWVSWDDNNVKTGCYNVDCPGFVLVNDAYPLNYVFPKMSELDKPSIEMRVEVNQDRFTGDWWLNLDGVKLGYWPESIFTDLRRYKANVARFGGEVFIPAGESSPGMGRGKKFRNGLYDRTCYCRGVYVYDDNNFPTPPDHYGTVETFETNCYFVGDVSNKPDNRGYSFLFGGKGSKDKNRIC